MAYLTLVLNTGDSAANLLAALEQNTNAPDVNINRIANYIVGGASGTNAKGSIQVRIADTPSVGTITFTGQPANNEAFQLNGVSFTIKTSGATGNQANLGIQVSETCSNTTSSRVSVKQATVTFTGAPTVGQTVTLNGVVFTVIATGQTPVGNQFAIGSTITATALNLANAINNSTSVGITDGFGQKLVVATPLVGVVTVDASDDQALTLTCLNIATAVNNSATAKVKNAVVATYNTAGVVTFTTSLTGSETVLETLASSGGLTNGSVVTFAGGTTGSNVYSYSY